eukprot:gene14907-biopygen17138
MWGRVCVTGGSKCPLPPFSRVKDCTLTITWTRIPPTEPRLGKILPHGATVGFGVMGESDGEPGGYGDTAGAVLVMQCTGNSQNSPNFGERASSLCAAAPSAPRLPLRRSSLCAAAPSAPRPLRRGSLCAAASAPQLPLRRGLCAAAPSAPRLPLRRGCLCAAAPS